MGVTAFPHPANLPQGEIKKGKDEPDWAGIAAGGSFLAGGLLLLTGRKKAGLAMTAGAMALTMLDQQDTIKQWWNTLPSLLGDAQRMLDRAQNTIDELAAGRDKLRSMFDR